LTKAEESNQIDSERKALRRIHGPAKENGLCLIRYNR